MTNFNTRKEAIFVASLSPCGPSVCEVRMGNTLTGNSEDVTKKSVFFFFFLIVTAIEFSETSVQFCQPGLSPIPRKSNLHSTWNFFLHWFDTTEDRCVCHCR